MLSFTILTTEGSAVTRNLHDRMPAILDPSGFAGWLEHGTVEPLADLEAAVHLFPVSPQVDSPKYHAEDCIAPVAGEALIDVYHMREAPPEGRVLAVNPLMASSQRVQPIHANLPIGTF